MSLHTQATNDRNKVVLLTIAAGTFFVLSLVVFVMTSDDLRERDIGGEDGELGGEFNLIAC